VIDLDPDVPLDRLVLDVRATTVLQRHALALRGSTLYEPYFAVRPVTPSPDAPISPRSNVLITGGTGALGRWLAGWLCAEGARRVRLVSRHTARASRWVAQLSGPTAVELVDADLADERQASHAAGDFDTIFHLAGDIGDALGAAPDEALIDRCFRPKVDGLLNLHRAMPAGMRRVVVFSSVAALTGSTGQAAYAAANAAMVAAAQQIFTPDVDLRVLWFGPWDGGGMATGDEVRARLSEKGVAPMAPWRALVALRAVLSSAQPTAVIVERAESVGGEDAVASPAHRSRAAEGEPQRAEVLSALRMASPEDQAARLEAEIVRQVAAIMEVEPGQIDPARSVYDIGFDSLMALELKNAVLRDYGVTISLAEMMQFNTVRDVAQALGPVLLGRTAPDAAKELIL
jgi:acyl carrier protein